MCTLAYVTYQDICSIQAFQEQIVIAIKAPEETKLEIPIPKEDCIKVHVKSTNGPIDVYLCEVEQQKPGAKTFEDMNTVTCKTEPSVPPDEAVEQDVLFERVRSNDTWHTYQRQRYIPSQVETVDVGLYL
ncbi:hypothetical protein Q9233_004436 [Columba guinea]|nr:hypothetical protein Q9233_004436 [Columba guinea]